MINMHTNLLSAHKIASDESSGGTAGSYIMNNIHVEMLGVVNIGGDVIEWIHDYLKTHDGILNPEISSCFFYHGGMTIPDALVYAAEIVCLLIGAKPLTLVCKYFYVLIMLFLCEGECFLCYLSIPLNFFESHCILDIRPIRFSTQHRPTNSGNFRSLQSSSRR